MVKKFYNTDKYKCLTNGINKNVAGKTEIVQQRNEKRL